MDGTVDCRARLGGGYGLDPVLWKVRGHGLR
jgi:hypothetical protein